MGEGPLWGGLLVTPSYSLVLYTAVSRKGPRTAGLGVDSAFGCTADTGQVVHCAGLDPTGIARDALRDPPRKLVRDGHAAPLGFLTEQRARRVLHCSAQLHDLQAQGALREAWRDTSHGSARRPRLAQIDMLSHPRAPRAPPARPPRAPPRTPPAPRGLLFAPEVLASEQQPRLVHDHLALHRDGARGGHRDAEVLGVRRQQPLGHHL